MAWELQSHMHGHIVPSVYKAHLEAQDADGGETDFTWLANRYADQRWDEDTGAEGYNVLVLEALSDLEGLGAIDIYCDAIAEHASEYASTTNGGFEVYLDSHTSIPWCSEDEMQAWYA